MGAAFPEELYSIGGFLGFLGGAKFLVSYLEIC